MPARFQIPETHPERQREFLAWAAEWTFSEGFMPDALALAAYLPSNADGFPDALCVLQNRTTAAAEVHFATAHGVRLSRDLLRGFFGYAFRRLRAPRLIAPIRAWNRDAQTLALKSGFFIAGYQGATVTGLEDVVLFTLTPDNCRWLPPEPRAEAPAHPVPAPEAPAEPEDVDHGR